jgi:hypothetical protein
VGRDWRIWQAPANQGVRVRAGFREHLADNLRLLELRIANRKPRDDEESPTWGIKSLKPHRQAMTIVHDPVDFSAKHDRQSTDTCRKNRPGPVSLKVVAIGQKLLMRGGSGERHGP